MAITTILFGDYPVQSVSEWRAFARSGEQALPSGGSARLEAEADARRELEIMSRLRRGEGDWLVGRETIGAALAVVNDCVAAVEAHQPATRGVEFNDAAHVRREECPAPELEDATNDLPVIEGTNERDCANLFERSPEADEARTRFSEDAEGMEAMTRLDAEQPLRDATCCSGR
jgi:hypothetical protein